MTKDEFLEKFKDVLQREDDLSFDMVLDDLDEWDSLSIMATSAFLDREFGIKTSFSDYKNMKTVKDIADKVGI